MKNPFAGLFRARDKPKDVVSAATTFSFGGSSAGKSVSSCDDSEITAMRGRIVDKAGFQKFQNQYFRWYDIYKKDEAPLLSREKRIKHTMSQGIDTWG